MYRTFDELPIALSPMDIKEVMGISKNNAYALCNSQGFPAVRIGKLIRISKDNFIYWFNNTQKVDLQ